ncbi:hypothetical protein QE152_g15514 [Popillia japonica]|uniref:Uncharacterized protein n=1 Tax=Popillia japonica TaxID=7064 RepID=A0AAW1L7Q8_POPJA
MAALFSRVPRYQPHRILYHIGFSLNVMAALFSRVPRYQPHRILYHIGFTPNQRPNLFGWRFVNPKRSKNCKTEAGLLEMLWLLNLSECLDANHVEYFSMTDLYQINYQIYLAGGL